jgi:hypothetical protein
MRYPDHHRQSFRLFEDGRPIHTFSDVEILVPNPKTQLEFPRPPTVHTYQDVGFMMTSDAVNLYKFIEFLIPPELGPPSRRIERLSHQDRLPYIVGANGCRKTRLPKIRINYLTDMN